MRAGIRARARARRGLTTRVLHYSTLSPQLLAQPRNGCQRAWEDSILHPHRTRGSGNRLPDRPDRVLREPRARERLGEVGNHAQALGRDTPLPPLSFALAPLVPAVEYRREHISRSLGEIRAMPLGTKTSQRVRRAIVESLTPFPAQPGKLTMDQIPTDLTMRLDIVRAATDGLSPVEGHNA